MQQNKPHDPACVGYPTITALALTPAGAGVVYLDLDPARPRDLGTADEDFAVGYAFTAPGCSPEQYVAAIDRRMLECDLHAEVIAGHGLAEDLEAVCSAVDGGTLGYLPDLAALWPKRHRSHRPGETPRLIDTADDLASSAPDLQVTCKRAKLSSWYLDPARQDWRGSVTRALASALLAADSLGWCSWQALDIDPLIPG
ncbi:hypothetical protein ABIA39_008927 [Nocardia sp. GAS34]|uniref:hypothetical protein n=1 Tax=unclassified Nocardia TaxID=2637762 RepID=UPI003D198B76